MTKRSQAGSTRDPLVAWTEHAAPELAGVTSATSGLSPDPGTDGGDLHTRADLLAAAAGRALAWLESNDCPAVDAGVELHSALSVLRNAALLLGRLADLQTEQSAVPPIVAGEHRVRRLRDSVAALLRQARLHYDDFLTLLGSRAESLPRIR